MLYHGKASARSLTGPEAAEKEADKAEIEARKQAQEDTTEVVPNSAGCPSTPPGRKRTGTLVERTPGKPPTPARAAPALPQSSEASSPPHLPPSTSPARLYTGRGGRERKRTSKGATAKAEGWLPKPQPREWDARWGNTKVVYLENLGLSRPEGKRRRVTWGKRCASVEVPVVLQK